MFIGAHHDSTVEALWQAGALPITVAPLFPGIDLKLDDLESFDTLDMLVKLGHTLILTNIRGPVTAISGVGELTSLTAQRLADNPYARQQSTRHRRVFRGIRESANGTNWGRFGKLGRFAGRTLPGLDVGVNFMTAYDDYRNDNPERALYHVIEGGLAGFALAVPASAPFTGTAAGLMWGGEMVYDHRDQIADAAEFAWNNPDSVSKVNPTLGGGIYAAKGANQAAEWTWDKATELWPF